MDPVVSCKTKTSQETQRSSQKFLEPNGKPKVIYADNSLEFGKLVKISPGITVRRHHTDRKQMGLLREQCAESSAQSERRYICSVVAIRSG